MHLPAESASETPLETLLRLAQGQPGRRPDFYQALLDSEVIVASTRGEAGGMTAHVAALLTIEGEKVIPFFTSVRVLRETFPEARYCASLPARELFEAAGNHMLHLNPRSSFGRIFTPEEIASLLSTGMIGQAVKFTSDVPLEIMEAEAPPAALITALTDLYSRIPEVEEAFLTQVGGEANTTGRRLLLALEMSAPGERVIRATAAVVREVDEAQQFLVDVIVLSDASDLAWARDFRAKVEPFYQSNWRGRMVSSNSTQLS